MLQGLTFYMGITPDTRNDKLKALRKEMDLPVAALLDTKGPEVRLKSFKNGSVELKAGAEFTLYTTEVEGDESKCSVTYNDLPGDLKPGDSVLLDDGLISGLMKDKKGVNIPGVRPLCQV